MKIGLFGGTFNPVHQCHLVVAEAVRQRMGLDRVLFIPAGDPPHKDGEEILEARHRFEMVRLAIQSHSGFSISDLEIKRSGKSYAVDTVQALLTHYQNSASLFFIIGLDAFFEIGSWKNFSKLLSSCHFIVISRKGFFFKDLMTLSFLSGLEAASLGRLDRQEVPELVFPLSGERNIYLLNVSHCEASSTHIRMLLNRGKRVKNLLPHSVESYIIKNKLYHPLEAKR